MNPPLFAIEGLGIRYAGQTAPALADVSISMRKGERLAVIGESGSGKTTLARALADLLPPGTTVTGRIVWPALGHGPRPGNDFGFVFQDPGASLDPVMRVGDQLAEVLRALRGLSRRAAEAEARALLERVRLPEPERLLRSFPHELSGGQKQRVSIALAIAGRPALLIADEPTSALDTIVQAEVMALIARLVAEEGMSLLLVTHDLGLASSVADRIAVLNRGRLVEWGEAGEVVSRPADPYTRSLLDAYLPLDVERA